MPGRGPKKTVNMRRWKWEPWDEQAPPAHRRKRAEAENRVGFHAGTFIVLLLVLGQKEKKKKEGMTVGMNSPFLPLSPNLETMKAMRKERETGDTQHSG